MQGPVCTSWVHELAHGVWWHLERSGSGDPSCILLASRASPCSRWLPQGAAPPEQPAPWCGCQARRPRAGAPMGFSMTASGPGRLCSRHPWPARAPGFFQGSIGAWRSHLRSPAQSPPGPLSKSLSLCPPLFCALGSMIEHKVGDHPDPRASELRDGANRATSPWGGCKSSRGWGSICLQIRRAVSCSPPG